VVKVKDREKWKKVRRRLEPKRKEFHDHMVEIVFNNPNSVFGEGEVLLKEKSLCLGGDSNRETIDLLFLLKKNDRDLEIIEVEVKGGRGDLPKGIRQLNIAKNYFFKNWFWWLDAKKEKLNIKGKFDIWLVSMLLFCQVYDETFHQIGPNLIFSQRKTRLGEVLY